MAGMNQFAPEEIFAIETYAKSPGAAPSPEVRALIDRASPLVDNMLHASSHGYSDFGLDYSQGFDMKMLHLGKMRLLARIVQADSMLRLNDGDGASAAQRIAAIYRLADHLGDDHRHISSQVGRAIFEIAEVAADSGFDRGVFDPASAWTLLRSTQSFDQRDPFQSLDLLYMEQALVTNSIRELLSVEDAQKRSDFFAMFAVNREIADELSNMSPEMIENQLKKYGELMNRYATAFSETDPSESLARMEEIQTQFDAGDVGLVARLFFPALGRTFDLMNESRENLRARIEMLESVAKDQIDLQTLTNAAVWYRRGIARLDELDESWRATIMAFGTARPLSPEQIEQLTQSADSVQAAISDFVEGSNMRRCDFSIGRDAREVFVPCYSAGMRDAFRVLGIEAMRLAATEDLAGAATLLAASFRIAADLADDALLVSSLVARDGFMLTS